MGATLTLILGSLGIAQALFLVVYLLSLKTGNRQAHVFLAMMLLGLTIRIGKAVVFNFTEIGPWPRNLGISGFLLAGPFLWLYGRALLNKEHLHFKQYGVHLWPFMAYVLLSPVIPNRADVASAIQYNTVLAHFGSYIFLSWGLWNRVRSRVRDALHRWYRNTLIGVTLVALVYAGIFFRLIPFYVLGATAFSLLIYVFAFLFLQKHQFALEKYVNSSVDVGTSKKLVQRARTLFETEHPYLDPKTSLAAVAHRIGVAPRVLSQAINESEQVNFSEFVNRYRIRHAQALLRDPKKQHEKIATIAFDSGFGNVTSFNTAFKAQLNQTPSQFRKQAMASA